MTQKTTPLDHLLFEKPPEVDPKLVTRQMLLNSNIFRKRNSNVSPLQSTSKNKTHKSRFYSPKRSHFGKHLPAQIMDSQ